VIDTEVMVSEFLAGICNVMATEQPTFLTEERIREVGYQGDYLMGSKVISREPLAMVTRCGDGNTLWRCRVYRLLSVDHYCFDSGGGNEHHERASVGVPDNQCFWVRVYKYVSACYLSFGNYGETYNTSKSRLQEQE